MFIYCTWMHKVAKPTNTPKLNLWLFNLNLVFLYWFLFIWMVLASRSCACHKPLKLSLSESFFTTLPPTKYNFNLSPGLLISPLYSSGPFINSISTTTISLKVTILSCDSGLDYYIHHFTTKALAADFWCKCTQKLETVRLTSKPPIMRLVSLLIHLSKIKPYKTFFIRISAFSYSLGS